MSEKSYIYALCELRYTKLHARYVGRSKYPQIRRGQHVAGHFDSAISRKKQWIQELRRKRKTPLLIILEEVEASQASEAEKRWIQHFMKLGCKLTNGCGYY